MRAWIDDHRASMNAEVSKKPRVFSAIQPTGKFHLGNYIRALSQWVENQVRYDGIYSIADLHALAAMDSCRAGSTAEKVRQTAALLVAAGLDPDRSAFSFNLASLHMQSLAGF